MRADVWFISRSAGGMLPRSAGGTSSLSRWQLALRLLRKGNSGHRQVNWPDRAHPTWPNS